MSETNNFLAWIERAEEDYAIAKYALRRKNPLLYPTCFHAHQYNDYSVQVRYPGETPSFEDAREALRVARMVRSFVRKFLGVK